MDAAAYIHALNNDPSALDTMPAEALETLVEAYPYFQLGHVALLKQYKRTHPDRFANYLPLAATYAPDRARLQELVMDMDHKAPEASVDVPEMAETYIDEPEATSAKAAEPEVEEKATADTPAGEKDGSDADGWPEMPDPDVQAETKPTVSDILAGLPETGSATEPEPEPEQETTDLPGPTEKHSFTEWLHRLKPPVHAAETGKEQTQKAELLSDEDQEDPLAQQFQAAAYEASLVREASRQPDPMPPVAEDENVEEDEPDYKAVEQQARKSVEMNDALLSETLATVFVIQRNYKKAIEVYEKLRLKIPEKSHYFAARIAELQSK